MKNLMQKIQSFWREEDGLVAIEYGLMAVFIALAIAVGAEALGGGLGTLFTNIATCFDATAGGACPVGGVPG